MTQLGIIAQIAIVLCGGSAALLIGSKDPNVRRWAYCLALCGEPFWLYSSLAAGQWGIVLMGLVYTFGQIRGIYNHFGQRASVPAL